MKQKYFYTFLLFIFLFSAPAAFSQESPQPEIRKEIPIEDLSIYPNPASGERIYISTKKDLPKKIEVFNVLGKPVLSARITGIELNISSLEPGIYIIKIFEDKGTATRKLVIR